ncbi:MAG TPA: MauE/DoxX family redox-associated membrane protein [Opitutaceae bacterium]
MKTKPWLLVARLVLAGLFVYAGSAKALAPAAFAADIANFRLLPLFESGLLAVYLPWLEILAGGALLIGRWRAGGALVVALLSAVFLGALLSARLRGLDITCGCFGHANSEGGGGGISGWLMARNGVLLALALVVSFTKDGAPTNAPSPAEQTPTP